MSSIANPISTISSPINANPRISDPVNGSVPLAALAALVPLGVETTPEAPTTPGDPTGGPPPGSCGTEGGTPPVVTVVPLVVPVGFEVEVVGLVVGSDVGGGHGDFATDTGAVAPLSARTVTVCAGVWRDEVR